MGMERRRHAERRSIDAAAAYAREQGFQTREKDMRDIDGTVKLELSGHGELYEVYYKEHPDTGYWRFDYGFVHDDHGGGDLVRTWRWMRFHISRPAPPDI